MRTALLIIFLILICKVSSFGSHIVGGEFELVYLTENDYRLNLIIYFDEINGQDGAKYSPLPLPWIYRKRDNAVIMSNIELPLFSEEPVEYTVPDCADDTKVKTTKLVFSRVITLNPNDFTDPLGYYIVWQRCCRNYDIKNVVSDDPDAGGVGSGQTFYLEIPPLIKGGERFINNSPQLFPPLSDYACVNRSYYADFKGVDSDGDSLVYRLAEPLNTPTATPHPQPPSTAPYPIVQWEPGFGLNNIVAGDPDLYISKDGLLKVTPTLEGIFVFAVKVEEYRDGVKIGEVRRDFQMVVVDDCDPPGEEPDITITLEDNTTYSEGDTLRFLADDNKCVTFDITDPKGGKVSYRFNSATYNQDEISATSLGGSPTGDSIRYRVCFTGCPPEKDVPFDVDFIGLDRSCPQPLMDTVKLTVLITPPDNDLPEISHKEDVDASYSTSTTRMVKVQEKAGGLKIVELLGLDDNNDLMDFMLVPVDFELADYGMSVELKSSVEGRVESWLRWNYDCQQVSFDAKSSFEIQVYLEDQDDCLYEEPDMLTLFLEVELPDNSEPTVFSNQLGSTNEYARVEAFLEDVISFDVRGEDEDGDFAVIQASAANFNYADYEIVYTGASGIGNSGPTKLNSTFRWPLRCELFNLAVQDSFRIYFTIEDLDKCEITNQDTLTVDFILSPTPNDDPIIDVESSNALKIDKDTIHVIVGNQILLDVTGQDFDGDSVRLSLIPNEEEVFGYSFNSVPGLSVVKGTFDWTPECFVLNGERESFVTLNFVVQDDHCTNPLVATTSLVVHIKDIDDRSEFFVAPNIFTPNGDDFNEYFGMYKINEQTGQEENILPLDNCAGQFREIVIYNRWGREVFSSSDREFKWYGKDISPGIYFYNIDYSNRSYKGSLTVRF